MELNRFKIYDKSSAYEVSGDLTLRFEIVDEGHLSGYPTNVGYAKDLESAQKEVESLLEESTIEDEDDYDNSIG